MFDAASEIAFEYGNARDAAADSDAPPRDDRFYNLLGSKRWAELPAAVQARFSKPYAPHKATVYSGFVAETRLSRVGLVLAQLARAIGGPLPFASSGYAPAVVSVIDDEAARGQHWTRTYARPGGFPQVVHSSKRFAGPTGLEEYVGCGVGMTLKLDVIEGALVFTSERYFFGTRRWRLYLPRALEPGVMTITHRPQGRPTLHGYADGAWFSFELSLVHRRFGELLYQLAYFKEV